MTTARRATTAVEAFSEMSIRPLDISSRTRMTATPATESKPISAVPLVEKKGAATSGAARSRSAWERWPGPS
jgi:hypothetical protein